VQEAGGTVVVSVPRLPKNFNPSTPQGANQITAAVMEQVWPQAFVTDSQSALTTEPGFLEDAEVESLSPFTVVYTLNPKAVWSDGTPIGVADFVYNWQQQLRWAPDLGESGLAAGYEAISSITSSNGGSAIAVEFSHPYTEWESLFSDLVPAHIGERYGWAAAFEGFNPARVVSGGPFEVTSYTPGVRLVLSRNPHYWFTPAGVAHIILEVEPSADALSDLETGRVEIAQTAPGPAVGEAVASAAHDGLALTASTVELPTLWQLCFNTTYATVDSVAFRTGIEHSLYLGEIAADSVGLDDAAALPYGNQLELGQASSGPASNVFGSGTSPAGGVTPSGAGIGYDLAAATSSFLSAGYIRGPSGTLRLAATGQRVKLSLLVPSGVAVVQQAAAVIQAQLGAVGIEVAVHFVSLGSMLGTLLPSGGYQMALAPFLLTTFPATQLPVYSASVLPAGAPPAALDSGAGLAQATAGVEPGATEAGVVTRDVFGLDDATVTSDLTGALTNLSPTDDGNLIVAAETQLWLDLPTIPLFQQPVDVVYASNVTAVSDSPTWAGVFWDAQDWVIGQSPAVVTTSVPPAS